MTYLPELLGNTDARLLKLIDQSTNLSQQILTSQGHVWIFPKHICDMSGICLDMTETCIDMSGSFLECQNMFGTCLGTCLKLPNQKPELSKSKILSYLTRQNQYSELFRGSQLDGAFLAGSRDLVGVHALSYSPSHAIFQLYATFMHFRLL